MAITTTTTTTTIVSPDLGLRRLCLMTLQPQVGVIFWVLISDTDFLLVSARHRKSPFPQITLANAQELIRQNIQRLPVENLPVRSPHAMILTIELSRNVLFRHLGQSQARRSRSSRGCLRTARRSNPSHDKRRRICSTM